MKYKFTAAFNIEGKQITHAMEYDSVDIVKTLERRLKTAFPNATGITITLNQNEKAIDAIASTLQTHLEATPTEAPRLEATPTEAPPRGARR